MFPSERNKFDFCSINKGMKRYETSAVHVQANINFNRALFLVSTCQSPPIIIAKHFSSSIFMTRMENKII